MCTAVVGGSIHRAATSISTASTHSDTIPIPIHFAADLNESLRNAARIRAGLAIAPLGVLICVSKLSATSQSTRQRRRPKLTIVSRRNYHHPQSRIRLFFRLRPLPTEILMHKTLSLLALSILAPAVFLYSTQKIHAQTKNTAYPSMAPLDQYLIADRTSEIALARTAAPASISDQAEIMVLTREGYTSAEKGSNGFLCLIERGWGAATDEPEFWNPAIRAPICFNPAAAKTFVPIYLMKTKLALAGKSKQQVLAATNAAFDKGELPALAPGAMCYMMSPRQYLNDRGRHWHPHLMFFVQGDAAKSWGADLPGSPIIAAPDPEERVTIFMVVAAKWSDATPAPAAE
jgi:hypothetical protein